MRTGWITVIFSLLLIPCGLAAQDGPMLFDDPGKQERFEGLLEETRCLVCQNQSLADSHADLAQDLRKQIFTMIDDGQTNSEIQDYLVERYGEFVLYRPRLGPTTVLLWFGPFFLLLVALFMVYRFVRSRQTADVIIEEHDRNKIADLLGESTQADDSEER